MEESLVNVEFLKSSNNFIARIQSELGGMREYRSSSFSFGRRNRRFFFPAKTRERSRVSTA